MYPLFHYYSHIIYTIITVKTHHLIVVRKTWPTHSSDGDLPNSKQSWVHAQTCTNYGDMPKHVLIIGTYSSHGDICPNF